MSQQHNQQPQKPKTPFTRTYLILGIFSLILGVALGIYTSNLPVAKPQLSAATLLEPPISIEEPGLIDHNGQPFGLQELRGKWHFVFFGYTHCPDVCPTTLFIFKSVAKQLKENHDLYNKTRFILTSVDPERDKSNVLKQYVQFYNPDFIGLTGDNKKIYNFSRALGVIYVRNKPLDNDPNNYGVDHSAAVLLLNPEGKLQAVFSAPIKPDALLKDFQSIVTYYKDIH